MKKVLNIILFLSLFITACQNTATDPKIIIIPKQCKLSPGAELPLSLESSNKPTDAVITWTATKGTFKPTTGLNVVYTAPEETGLVIINASLQADGEEFSTTLTCEVAGMQIVTEPTLTLTPEKPEAPIPSFTAIASETPAGLVGDTIAITEVMAYPCGFSDSMPSINEYIELYNYGAEPVDVGAWWIGTTGGGQGTPDQLVSWNTVNPKVNLSDNLKLNSTVIAPGSFAVVISPKYHTGQGNLMMPYAFPKDTTILTFATSNYVGNDSKGLSASQHPITTIVLYKGSKGNISSMISTYGTPSYGASPDNIKDDKLDNLPYFVTECHAMERVDSSKPDSQSNWREINVGTPGSGNYK